MTDDLNERIQHAERVAIGKAMCGKWTAADDAELEALYAERRRRHGVGAAR